MFERNRIANVNNRFQNWQQFKRSLCLCSAGLLRSPTLAFVLSQPPFNRNVRAAGTTNEFALVPVDAPLLEWADEIVCVEPAIEQALLFKLSEFNMDPDRFEIITLDVPDVFDFRSPELIEVIETQCREALTFDEA